MSAALDRLHNSLKNLDQSLQDAGRVPSEGLPEDQPTKLLVALQDTSARVVTFPDDCTLKRIDGNLHVYRRVFLFRKCIAVFAPGQWSYARYALPSGDSS